MMMFGVAAHGVLVSMGGSVRHGGLGIYRVGMIWEFREGEVAVDVFRRKGETSAELGRDGAWAASQVSVGKVSHPMAREAADWVPTLGDLVVRGKASKAPPGKALLNGVLGHEGRSFGHRLGRGGVRIRYGSCGLLAGCLRLLPFR